MCAENGWLGDVSRERSSLACRASSPLAESCTEKAPSTGQSSFGVKRSSLSLVQNHVPASDGERSTPLVTAVLICLSGATDSLNTTVSGLIAAMPLGLYSVSPG